MTSTATSRVVCPGSFDTITHGHLDIIGRATRMFDEVVVSIGANSTKPSQMFTVEERLAMITEVCARWPQVRAVSFTGLLVDHCAEIGALGVVKGLRSATDFDYELPMAHLNRQMSGLETILLPTAQEWSAVSSTMVREISRFGGDISALVPPTVAEQVTARVRVEGQR